MDEELFYIEFKNIIILNAKKVYKEEFPCFKHLKYEKLFLSLMTDVRNTFNNRIHRYANKFIHAFITAYNYHYSFMFSVEDFWTLILEGVTFYLNSNKEIKDKLIKDKNIKIDLNFNTYNLENFTKEYEEFLYKKFNKDYVDNIKSISTKDKDINKLMPLLSINSKLESYSMFVSENYCGFPRIYLRGSIKEYKEIIKRINKLEIILENKCIFLKNIKPIMIKILDTRRGNIKENLEWWTKIISFEYPNGSSSSSIKDLKFNGWLSEFFKFYINEKKRTAKLKILNEKMILYTNENNIIFRNIDKYISLIPNGKFKKDKNKKKLTIDSIPSGILESHINSSIRGKKIKLSILSGFFGMNINNKERIIKPVRGIMILERNLKYFPHSNEGTKNVFIVKDTVLGG